MKITRTILDKTAHLARLEFSEKEADAMVNDLQKIVSFVEKLKEVDTTGVEPLTTMSQEVNTWREDEVKNQLSAEEALQPAPKKNEQFFLVPKVVDHEN